MLPLSASSPDGHAGKVLGLTYGDVPGRNLENRREPPRSNDRPRAIEDPGSEWFAFAFATEGLGVLPDFLSGDVRRKPDDDAVFDQTGYQPAACVNCREAEHATEADATVLIRKFVEEWPQVCAKRNRHEGKL